ncbi:hypothetical protein Nepgr_001682 [Nepenthes gracilis]|uniref:Filament-like plant protein 3 n=1 Tax=Nepenthes gracilis TaxID=150966 RepID=A0AAD3P7L3_NEPGR|nr:hypothetical protein Nepgr_001682 [Nepenthes gracilis]
MDRRNWLWRKKSSEKSPRETESSGSVSSHSERLSDEQVCLNNDTQSPEVTSKAARGDEQVSDNMGTLAEKLAAALSNISAKEELIKQHAKVAEEAITGWEKSEKEVSTLKQQLEVAIKKNTTLEDRVGHLDGALKECVRQLRQARELIDQKVLEAVAKTSQEWESKKSELECQLVELHAQLETAKVEASVHLDSDIQLKLDAAEKENASLRLEIVSLSEQLEVRTLERDLSTQTAEAASKQHLESIKRAAKLEAELRRLKSAARKASPMNDSMSFTASSAYVDSLTDSQSDSGERLVALETDLRKARSLELSECDTSHSDSWALALIKELDQFKRKKFHRKNLVIPSSEINLMDDFLEVERLASLPETEQGGCSLETGTSSDKLNKCEGTLKAELDALIDRTADLKEKLEKKEAEKMELEIALTECQQWLEQSQEQVKDAEVKLTEFHSQLTECQDHLNTSQAQLKDTEIKLMELQCQLMLANELKLAAEGELEASNAKKQEAESQVNAMEAETRSLSAIVSSLGDEIEKEQALSAEAAAKCRKLEDELARMKCEADLRRAASLNGELKMQQEKEIAVAAGKLTECQKTIASLGRQLKSLATLEDFLMDLN